MAAGREALPADVHPAGDLTVQRIAMPRHPYVVLLSYLCCISFLTAALNCANYVQEDDEGGGSLLFGGNSGGAWLGSSQQSSQLQASPSSVLDALRSPPQPLGARAGLVSGLEARRDRSVCV